jgi:hypothetical protein
MTMARNVKDLTTCLEHANLEKTVGRRHIPRIRLAEMMSPWGGDFSYGRGTDAVRAVASFYSSNKVCPDKGFVKEAFAEIVRIRDGIDSLSALASFYGWTPKDVLQLRNITGGLKYYLKADYQEDGAVNSAPLRYATYRSTPRNRFLIFAQYRKTYDDDHKKGLHLLAEARDAQEAWTELWRLDQDTSWTALKRRLVIVDTSKGRNERAPVVDREYLKKMVGQ